MQKLVVRYLTGSRADQTEVFPADSDEELIAGRDPLSSILFDPDQDDLVSRQHLKITRDPNHPGGFRLEDLQSRNGTYINQKRVYGSTILNHNDRVQLGPSGPEFRVELDPPPKNDFVSSSRDTLGGYDTGRFGGAGASRPIGRATVERMLDDTFGLLKQESTKTVIVGLLCIAAVLIVGIGTWLYMRKSAAEVAAAQQQSQQSIEQIAREVQKAHQEEERQRAAETERQEERFRKSEEANKKLVRSLSNALETIRRNQAADELARRKQSAAQNGGVAVAEASSGAPTFSQLVDRVDSLVAANKYTEAAAVATQMMQFDPNRYEGYFYGGVSALQLGEMAQARGLLKQAIAKAPLAKQTALRDLLSETTR